MGKMDDGDIERADYLFGNGVAVTPSNSTVYDPPLIGLYVGGVGDVSVDLARGGVGLVFKAVPAGTFLKVLAKKVNLTGTTATLIIGGL